MAEDYSPIRSCKICILFVILLIIATPIFTSAESNSRNVRHRLKRLNKPPVKTIKSPDGDIIDCVDIAHQPAFDHPLVRNHTIQMRPSFRPEGVVSGESDVVSCRERIKICKPVMALEWKVPRRNYSHQEN
ncbi:hypothetical protein OIU78_018280 [Salix suchowensis]|nr:hypothetical protein OIU78_018280 [Salix suchowensis]